MKLTNAIRETIFRNLLAVSPLMATAKKTVKERADLLEEIRQACLKQEGTSDAEIDATVKKVRGIKSNAFLNIGIYTEGSVLKFAIRGESRELLLTGNRNKWINNQRKNLSNPDIYGKQVLPTVNSAHVPQTRVLLSVENADLFYDRLIKSDVETEGLFDAFNAYQLQIMAALNTCTTDTALLKAWPDVAPYLPKTVVTKSTDVALSAETLNAICGIPQ